MNFIVIRLGKDSIEDINKLIALGPNLFEPFVLDFKCKQVESSINAGAYTFVYIGSDNNKGIPTDWKQGLKAIGVLERIDGRESFQSESSLRIKVFSIFETSLDQFDFLEKSSILYKYFSQYPIIGVKSSRNNSVQKVNEGKRENSSALLTSIASLHSKLVSDITINAPELLTLLNFLPDKMEDQFAIENKTKNNQSKNQILYGPPGTGKTHNAINHALAIIKGYDLNDLIEKEKTIPNFRKESKKEFDELVKQGQIEFVTFHQSYSYEEFVEGIKPSVNGENVEYNIEDGIFKKLCLKAQKVESYDFEDIYDDLTSDLSKVSEIKLKTSVQKKDFVIRLNDVGEIYAITSKGKPVGISQKALFDYLKKGDIPLWHDGSYVRAIGNYLKEKYSSKIQRIDNSSNKFVLIIDEINRGNMSKIFGELITLIEDSKRIGAKEELRVRLTYSGSEENENFGVPDNVYIVGTMNSADRSIALIDTALRRRFTFFEYTANPILLSENIEGINLKELLSMLNNRIEFLLDKDHLLGHAYFINVASKRELCEEFRNKVIPLLEEYFYCDYEKIQLVLGDNKEFGKTDNNKIIIAKQTSEQKKFFGKEIDGYEEKILYTINKKIADERYDEISSVFFTSIYRKVV